MSQLLPALAAELVQLEDAQLMRRLVELEPAYIFKHALVQDTAYASLLKSERRRLHREVAEAYERLYPDRLDDFAALLAQHYQEAGDEARTFDYATRAGHATTQLYAYAEARLHYNRALDALTHFPHTEENRRHRMDLLVKQVSVSYHHRQPQAYPGASNGGGVFGSRVIQFRQERSLEARPGSLVARFGTPLGWN